MSIFCLFTAIHSYAIDGDYWVERASMNEARGRLGVAVIGDKIYAIGGDMGSVIGLDPSAQVAGTTVIVNTNEEYNTKTDTWTMKTPMPTARDHFGIAVYDNKVYCIGGQTLINGSISIIGTNEVYNPTTDTWETKTPMPTAGRFQIANVVNGKIYVTGAIDNNLNQAYDPLTDSWTTKTVPPHKIWSYASAVYNNKIYFIGLSNQTVSEQFIQIYDTANDRWDFGTPSPSYLGSAAAGIICGSDIPPRIYFFGNNATYVYNPETDSWSTGTSMLTTRGYFGVATVNNTFYAVGGIIFPDGYSLMSPTSVNEQYIPAEYEIISSSPQPSPTIPEMSPLSIILMIVAMACVTVVLAKMKNRYL